MADLRCADCGTTASYADAALEDRLRTCGGDHVVKHTALGPVYNGGKHDWIED